MADLLIPAEVDGGVFLLKGQQAWIGCSGDIPGEAALGRERNRRQLRLELPQARFPLVSQIEHLQIGSRGRAGVCIGRFDHLKDRLAEGTGLGEFGETPLGIAPVGALEDQQRLRLIDLAVEGLLPIGPRRDADMLVEVKERRLESLLLQPSLDPGCGGAVAAGMGQENSGHV